MSDPEEKSNVIPLFKKTDPWDGMLEVAAAIEDPVARVLVEYLIAADKRSHEMICYLGGVDPYDDAKEAESDAAVEKINQSYKEYEDAKE